MKVAEIELLVRCVGVFVREADAELASLCEQRVRELGEADRIVTLVDRMEVFGDDRPVARGPVDPAAT